MAINDILDAKTLREQGRRLGRGGMSRRVIQLVQEFLIDYPDGHYQEAIILAGRLHAISLASRCDDYWGEKSSRGFYMELGDIRGFEFKQVEVNDEN